MKLSRNTVAWGLITVSLVLGSKAWQYTQTNKTNLAMAQQDLATVVAAAETAEQASEALKAIPVIGKPAETKERAISTAILMLNRSSTLNGVQLAGVTVMGGSSGNVKAEDITSTFQMTSEKAHKSRITLKLSYVDFEGLKSFLNEISMSPVIIKTLKIYKDVIDADLEFISVDA